MRFFPLLLYIINSFSVNAQNWNLIGNEPNGHNAEYCSRCQQNLQTIGISKGKWNDKIILNYWTDRENFLSDHIFYQNQDGSTNSSPVAELSNLPLPDKLKLVDGSEVNIVNIGVINPNLLTIEGIYSPTPNQVVSKRLNAPISNFTNETKLKIYNFLTELEIQSKKAYGFITAIEQNKNTFTFKFGKYGISKNFSYFELGGGSNKIDKIHQNHYLKLKTIGLKLFKEKELAYRSLHLTNPIDVDEEMRLEQESREEGKRIKAQNEILLKNYNMLITLADRLGISRYNVPYPDLITHIQYYAHPEWSEIEKVYKDVHDFLDSKLVNWNATVTQLPSVPLKQLNESNEEIKKKIALGAETKEGFYKIKVDKGEFKLYILPNNNGISKIRKNKPIYQGNDVDRVIRSFEEIEFSFELKDSPDLSFKELEITSEKVIRSMNSASVDGASIDDYRIIFRENKIDVFDNRSNIPLEVQRLRSVVIPTKKINTINKQPEAFNTIKSSLTKNENNSGINKISLHSEPKKLLNLNKINLLLDSNKTFFYENNTNLNLNFVILKKHVQPANFILEKMTKRNIVQDISKNDNKLYFVNKELKPFSETEINFNLIEEIGEYLFIIMESPVTPISKREIGTITIR